MLPARAWFGADLAGRRSGRRWLLRRRRGSRAWRGGEEGRVHGGAVGRDRVSAREAALGSDPASVAAQMDGEVKKGRKGSSPRWTMVPWVGSSLFRSQVGSLIDQVWRSAAERFVVVRSSGYALSFPRWLFVMRRSPSPQQPAVRTFLAVNASRGWG